MGEIEYRVRTGDTLWGIARRYKTSIELLSRANALHDDRLQVGQILRIPSGKDPRTLAGTTQRTNFVTATHGGKARLASATTPASPARTVAPDIEDIRSGKALLRFGMEGAAVKELQRLLMASGQLRPERMNTGPGIFGPATRSAVSAFQRAHHLIPWGHSQGIVDQPTLEALDAVGAAKRADFHPKGVQSEVKPITGQTPTSQSWLEAIWDWLLGTAQGDFNKDPSLSQIIVNMILGLIPVVDQVLDVRDIIAGLKDIIEYYLEDDTGQKRHESVLGLPYEYWIWLNIFIIAMGCIPEVGSAVKGVLRVLISFLVEISKAGGTLTVAQGQRLLREIDKVLKHLGNANPTARDWLKRFEGDLDKWLEKAFVLIKQTLNTLTSVLTSAEQIATGWIPKQVVGAQQLKELIAQLRKIKQALGRCHARLSVAKAEINRWMRAQLKQILDAAPRLPSNGAPRASPRVAVKSQAQHAAELSRVVTKSKDAARLAEYQYHAAAKELCAALRASRSTLYSGLDPALLLKVVNTAYYAAKTGIKRFDVFLKDLRLKNFAKNIDFDSMGAHELDELEQAFMKGVNKASNEFAVTVPYKSGPRTVHTNDAGQLVLDGHVLGSTKCKEVYKLLGLSHAIDGHGPLRVLSDVITEALQNPTSASGKFNSDQALLESIQQATDALKAGRFYVNAAGGPRIVDLPVKADVGRAFMLKNKVPQGIVPLTFDTQLPDVVELEVVSIRAVFNANGTIKTIYPRGLPP
ncbi:LysM peptidoglycan-binding domain-containing protein [Melittangium boletus]|uniref:LysM peptidoglycan-binding domain-containing protein n=1 Tax=Melittangium boletus TaxID=83453 RepID=UPI003DA5CAF0